MMNDIDPTKIEADWVHIAYRDDSEMREVYGFVGLQGFVNLEGIRFRPKNRPSKTLMIYMHPATTLQLLPVPRAMAAAGVHVLCAGSRYARNDTPLIMEKVICDLGAYVRHAREVWGYEKIVLSGWSGGGSLTIFYQSQAENPSITHTAAGDPIRIPKLIPADAVIFHAAHISRAEILRDIIDPSVLDESNPDIRDVGLDLYDPRNPNKPPYSADYIAYFRAAQLARIRRKTAYVKELLHQLRRSGNNIERAIVTHRTLADPRFLDPSIEPNDRKPGTSFMGDPKAANESPAGIARFSTLRAWLSQWSIDDSPAHAERNITGVSVPFLAIENSADDAVPKSHTSRVFAASASADKTFLEVKNANHYYVGQPKELKEALDAITGWLRQRNLLD